MIQGYSSSDLQYIFIIIDKAAPSFCHYNNLSIDVSCLMPLDTLKKSIEFCYSNNLHATIIYGKSRIPDEYQLLLSDFPHIKIKPMISSMIDNNVGIKDLFVVDSECDIYDFELLGNGPDKFNVILRINLSEVTSVIDIIKKFRKKIRRLNIIFKDIENASENIMNDFRIELNFVKKAVYDIWKTGEMFEMNFVTDRIFLKEMNNCDAGIKHITIAPNGKFYICPGNYYSNETHDCGSLTNGVSIHNQHLYHIDYASVCKSCDCYQCKRCIYLNKKMTLEVNTPSHEQCIISHYERNISGSLLSIFHKKKILLDSKSIPALYYCDPLDQILENDW